MAGGRGWGLTNIWNSGVMWGDSPFWKSRRKGEFKIIMEAICTWYVMDIFYINRPLHVILVLKS